MKSFKGVAFAVVAIALAATAQAGAAGPITVSSAYIVGGGTMPGANTGLVVPPGQVVDRDRDRRRLCLRRLVLSRSRRERGGGHDA